MRRLQDDNDNNDDNDRANGPADPAGDHSSWKRSRVAASLFCSTSADVLFTSE